jgi:general stress protein 26
VTVHDEVESLVADAPVSAHLATSVDDRPHVAPVWYGYRDGVLYFLTGGRKLENVRHNPRVALSIEDARGGDVAWNVTLLGRATVSDDPDRMDWARGWIYDRYDGADDDESPDVGDEPGSEPRTDGGESTDEDVEEVDYALVEVEVGSASWNVYE